MRLLVAGLALLVCWPACASCLNPDAVTPDGGRYCGPLQNGLFHGQGVIEWDNGERYEGGFVRGRFSGSGRLQFVSGDRYEGEFRDGAMEGRGRMALADGSVYTGEFRRDYFNGAGRLEHADGAVYTGAFKDGSYHGRGRLVYADGRSYDGEFQRNRFQGEGRFVGASGEVYEGEFVDDELTGKGRLTLKDGGGYEGAFVKWRYQGAGVFTDAQGNVYEGGFVNGELTGRGRLVQKNGTVYEGEFQRWRAHGQGVMRHANGDRYEGGFAHGLYDGQGTLAYAKPRPDGTARQSGTWRYGTLEDSGARARMLANVESALYAQQRLLDRSLAALTPQDPGRIDLYLLAVAGDGTQEVFRREVEFVRDQFAERFRTRGRSVVLVNSRSTVESLPMATVTSVGAALKAIAARMDPAQDILFLFITSHGSEAHELSLSLDGMGLPALSAAKLGELVAGSGIRWKVVVISACYGGGFADALGDAGTLFIAAARRDRQSFGCADENEFTYFGRAFFKESLPRSRSFEQAFRKAEALVRAWELEESRKAPAQAPAGAPARDDQLSLPQMQGAGAIEEHLRRWWTQLER